jgi:hypothetical protein
MALDFTKIPLDDGLFCSTLLHHISRPPNTWEKKSPMDQGILGRKFNVDVFDKHMNED